MANFFLTIRRQHGQCMVTEAERQTTQKHATFGLQALNCCEFIVREKLGRLKSQKNKKTAHIPLNQHTNCFNKHTLPGKIAKQLSSLTYRMPQSNSSQLRTVRSSVATKIQCCHSYKVKINQNQAYLHVLAKFGNEIIECANNGIIGFLLPLTVMHTQHLRFYNEQSKIAFFLHI